MSAATIASLVAIAISLIVIWRSNKLASEARTQFVRRIRNSPYREEVIEAVMRRLGPIEKRRMRRELDRENRV